MIPYGRQEITQQDLDAVIGVLQSDWLTQGPAIEQFETAIAHRVGAPFVTAVNSATSALHLACLALGVQPGDIVWTSPITFVASANCALFCGASVDFVDIDPQTFNMSPQALEIKLRKAQQEGRLPKVVIPVHMAGQSCEMEAIHALSQQYGFRIIEDASHAIGGYYQNQPIGNCRYSDIAVFSFHPVKIVTTGEGGAVVTQNPKLDDRVKLLRSHGITRNPDAMEGDTHGPWYYQQIDLGFNYRMTDLQAALGTSQLERLEKYIEQRHMLAKRYNTLLENLPVVLPWQHPDTYSAFHLYIIRLQTGPLRRQIFEALRAKEVGVQVHYIPVHTQPYYRRQGFQPGAFPVAEAYYEQAISLPMFPTLTLEKQEQVVQALKEALSSKTIQESVPNR
jgi:UDP-4-amino-4,6-dideoxy-N-acetyl-beta-L-altrosamine transaminase